MSFKVRIFGHQGIVPLKVVEDVQIRTDSVYQLKQPYIFAQELTADVTAVASTKNTEFSGHSQDPTSVLRIEVPDGKTIAYEVNPPNRNAVATASSPRISGRDQVQFGESWTISIIDVTNTP